jgi:hypothetical protein
MVQLKQIRLVSALMLCGAMAVIGCGGSGSSSGTIGTTSMRTKVAKAVQEGFASKAAGDSSSRTAKPISLTAPGFYRPEYALWATDVTGGVDFFVDEALTQLGGTERSSFTFEGSDFAATYTLNLTAGLLAGLKETRTKGMTNGLFTFSEEIDSPTEGKSSITGSVKDGEGEFNQTLTDLDGNTRKYVTRFHADGTVEVSYPNSSDFTFSLAYKSDSSGTGTVTGNSPLLPATIVWDNVGTGILTFADSSTLAFTNYQFNGI